MGQGGSSRELGRVGQAWAGWQPGSQAWQQHKGGDVWPHTPHPTTRPPPPSVKEVRMFMSLKRSTCGLHAVRGSVRAGVRILGGLKPVGGQVLCSALFWEGCQTRTPGFLGGLSASHHATPVQEAHIICDRWSELGAWGRGEGGGWGRGGCRGLGKLGRNSSRTWVDGCGPPSSPLCVVGSLTCPIGEPSGPIGWCVLMNQPVACML